MIRLQTPVTDTECTVGISFSNKIMMIGSCFSDNIGTMLKNYGFDVCVNPFGTLYNPASICQSIRRLINCDKFTSQDCVEIGAGDCRICSFSHHTSFARADKDEFLNNANQRLEEASAFFKSCNKVIITLGTAWCYRHIERDIIVSNCLKRHPNEFIREMMDVAEVKKYLSEVAELCPDKEFIFTVSPIRHFKDGAHGNQLSKSTLLLGINEYLKDGKGDYFHAYEIVMDELRDYRFYAEDMCHPTQQTANYICERFLDWALPLQEHGTLKENIRAWKHGCHIVK